jgi:hypothetical protein
MLPDGSTVCHAASSNQFTRTSSSLGPGPSEMKVCLNCPLLIWRSVSSWTSASVQARLSKAGSQGGHWPGGVSGSLKTTPSR